ncbi:redoxin domain-containing protein [Adonisia turfae]|uniref:AhpC/TSA family protein n=1 Tax=Adonisia turfae CCMR0081 TaxID=2292702 RepID=A0A6M0RRW4_9CYAN|nr:redoxin domain-containing protein [Adonisia turfae]NEZ59005.1 AhpC/TSA family protein [Adonisia turfae CCMR0081]
MTATVNGTSAKLVMGHPAPALEVNTLSHGLWNLADQTPENYTMIVFYRGLHCPVCVQYISELEQKLNAFSQLGVTVIAISGDDQEKAAQLQAKTNSQQLTLGYGLTYDDMRRWGLYLSKGHFDNEPTLFSEPALFLIKPNGHIYLANLGTHPFSRISFDFLIQGLEYVIPNNYPFRGTE